MFDEARQLGPEPAVLVRHLRRSDSLTELTQLLHRAYAPLAERGFRFVATYQDEATTRERVAQGDCFVAELEGRIVGTILLRPPTRSQRCAYYNRAGVASLHQFAVDPDLQQHGIGRRLLDAAEVRAREFGGLSAPSAGLRDLPMHNPGFSR